MENSEVIFYQPENESSRLEVIVEDESVWLTQTQMVDLFKSTKQNISLHINNIFKESELEPNSTVKEYLTVQIEGERKVRRKVLYYNLDVIISVGYRVKSKRGTEFRIWANKILKEYLLKGYALHQRIESIEKKIYDHDLKFDMLIKSNLTPYEGIFFDGQVFDAYSFVSKIIKSAQKSIILIDNYIDESVLLLLSKRNISVKATIYSGNITKEFKLDLDKFNKQYDKIEVKLFTKTHDRFMIIDNNIVYHIGASLKDLGKKWFAFSKIKIDAFQILDKLNDEDYKLITHNYAK
jgi:hypothetical protein